MAKKRSAPKVTDQTKLLQTMQTLLEEQAKVYEKINSMLSDQIKLTQELGDATQSAGKKATDSNQKQTTSQKELNDAIDNGIDKSREQDKANSIQVKSFKDLMKAIESTAKGAALLSTGMSTLSNMATFSKGVFSAFGGIIESTFSVGMGFVSAFIGTIDGLFAVGAEVYNIGLDIMRAWEDVRETFGNLAKNEGAAVKGAFDNLRAGTGGLIDGGKGLRLIFGDLQSQIAAVSSFAEGMGASFTVLKDSFVDNAKQTLMMNKGLGLTAEAFKELSTNAMVTGSSVTESLDEVMVTTMAMSEQFGVSGKLIGKNFNEMAKNVTQFGDLSEKELVATATYAAKLGLEIQTLTSVMDKFDTFDSAADSAGKLAEVMGMNVDVMKMMNAESPAERIDEMRRAFQDTGKSVSDLSRHELKMLQESMGFADAGELKRALSIPVDELGYDEMADAAEEAADKMTPEEAMAGMTNEIKKLVDQMEKMAGGPLSMFLKGLKDGISNSKPFLNIFGDIGALLSKIYYLGMDIGHMFAEEFFGTGPEAAFGTFMKALKDVMGVTNNTKDLIEDLRNNFKDFFADFKKDPSKAITTLFTNIQDSFKKMFSGQSGNLEIIKNGLINGLKGAFEAVGKLAPVIIKDAAKYLQMFVDGFKDFLAGKGGGAGTGLGGAFVDALSNIKDALVKDLMPVLGELFTTLFKAAAPYLIPIFAGGIGLIAMKGAVTGFASYFTTGMLTKVAQPFLKKAAGFLGFAFEDAAKDDENKDQKTIAEGLTEIDETAKAGASFGDNFNKLLDSFQKIDYKKIGKAALNMVAVGTIGIAALGVFGIAAAAFMAVAGTAIMAIGPEMIAAGLIASVTLAIVAVGAFKGLELVGKASPDYGSMAKGLLAAVVGIGALALFAAGISTDFISQGFKDVAAISLQLLAGLATTAVFIGSAFVLLLGAAAIGLLFAAPQVAAVIGISMAVGLAVLSAGLVALAEFVEESVIPTGNRIIKAVSKLTDPDALEYGLNLIVKVLDAFKPLLDFGTVAMSLAADMSGGFFSGPDPEVFKEIMKVVQDFMKDMGEILVGDNGVIGKIMAVVEKLAGYSQKELAKAVILVDIIGALGGLLGGLGPILETFSEMSSGMFTSTTTAVQNMKDLAGPEGPLMGLLDTMIGSIPQVATKLMEAADNITHTPEEMKAASEKIKFAMNATTDVMKIMKEVAEMGSFMDEGSSILGSDNYAYFDKFIEEFGNRVEADKGPAAAVALIAIEAQRIGEAMANIGEMDIGTVELGEMVKPILGYDGDKEFTVNPGNIAVKIKMNVTMNAGEVAQGISVAADGDSYFELTEKGKTAIEDMEDV